MRGVRSAIQRVRRRRQYPSGERIVIVRCETCRTPIWCWDDDPLTTRYYPYKKRCSYCRDADAAFFRKIT